MVHAVDDRRALAEPVDQIHVPQRAIAVERHRHQVSDEFLERGAVARGRKREMVHVVLEREVGIVFPSRQAQRQAALDHPLAKTRVAVDETALDDLLDAVPVGRLVEQLDGIDHHQVRRPVHVEPGRVSGGKPSAHACISRLSSGPRASSAAPSRRPPSPSRGPTAPGRSAPESGGSGRGLRARPARRVRRES